MFGLYIGIFQLVYLSEPEETPITTEKKEEEPAPLVPEAKLDEIIQPDTEEIDPDAEVSIHATMEKAIDYYRKIKEGKEELTEKELETLEKECETIGNEVRYVPPSLVLVRSGSVDMIQKKELLLFLISV